MLPNCIPVKPLLRCMPLFLAVHCVVRLQRSCYPLNKMSSLIRCSPFIARFASCPSYGSPDQPVTRGEKKQKQQLRGTRDMRSSWTSTKTHLLARKGICCCFLLLKSVTRPTRASEKWPCRRSDIFLRNKRRQRSKYKIRPVSFTGLVAQQRIMGPRVNTS